MDICYLACAYRTPSGYCGSTGGAATCPHRQKKQTNADRIRSMTDEELAEFLEAQTSLAHNYGYECADGEPDFPDGIPANYDYLTWLQQEVADGEQS